MKRALLALIIVASIGGAITLIWYANRPEPPEVEPVDPVEQALQFYEGRKEFERPIGHSAVPEGLTDMRSATCGACHTEIYDEWKVSTHARAWLDDVQFQEELKKSRGLTDGSKGDVGWLCINCHTPMVTQIPQLVVGLEDDNLGKPIYVDNPGFDPTMQLDAIGCATCHIKEGKVLGPYGNTDAPHATAKSDDLLTEAVCVRCHQAEHFYQSQDLGCYFTTGQEWADSKYGKAQQFCQDCHMPKVERKLSVMAGPVRVTRRHWFGGSLIPKKPEYDAEIAPLREHFDDGVEVTLVEWGADVELALKSQPPMAEVDQKIAAGKHRGCLEDCRKVVVRVSNDNAGHRMPTGDPERHVDIEASAELDGETVAKGWARLGSRYQWWPEIKKLADTRLAPDEARYIVLEVPTEGDVTISVIGHKYRMYKEGFEHHHLEGKYVRGVQFLDVRLR